MPTAQTVYEQAVKRLPAMEQLRLASLILEQLTGSGEWGDSWSEQDVRDVTAFSLAHAARFAPEELDV